MQVQSLCWEDPLEEVIAAHSSILAWIIPWTEEPGGLQLMGSQESDMSKATSVQFSHSVMSDSLGPRESQQARPPCPSPSPGVHSNSCPSSW